MTQDFNADLSNEYRKVPLFVFFWLPADKDAFGFENWREATLNSLARFQEGVYQPIGIHFAKQYKILENNGIFVRSADAKPYFQFVGDNKDLHIEDSEKLNLRKVSYNFIYTPSEPLSIAENQELCGRFSLYSSGLYVWRFDVHMDENKHDHTSPDAINNIKTFLERNFINDVLSKIFDYKWGKSLSAFDQSGHRIISKSSNGQRAYNGVLNYYQIEILYNYLFDTDVLPQEFFPHPDDKTTSSDKVIGTNTNSIGNIINSVCLVSWGSRKRQYFPLGSYRGSYSLKDASSDNDYLAPEKFIYMPREGNEYNALIEEFYARLSYAAIEHFMRAANTFGLSAYREGLEATRKIILLHNFRAKENVEPQQLYKESLVARQGKPEDAPKYGDQAFEMQPIVCTESYAEIYYELIKNKIPTLKYVYALIKDMKILVAPSIFRAKNSGNSQDTFSHEYRYSLSTIEEVLRQFHRSITAIENETEALRHLMERSGDRQILNELVETRKIHEFSAEDSIKVEIAPDQLQDISTKIGIWGFGFALFFSVLQVALWLLGELANNDSDFHTLKGSSFFWEVAIYSLIIAAIFASLPYLYIKISRMSKTKKGFGTSDELCISIYDFANLRYKLNIESFMKEISSLQRTLRPLFDQDNRSETCRVHHLLSEMPTSGLEKRKYTFGSAQGDYQENYTLHVEIEIHNGVDAFLTDIRLAVRIHPAERRDVAEAVESLITEYFGRLIGKEKNDPELGKLLMKYFGFGYRDESSLT